MMIKLTQKTYSSTPHMEPANEGSRENKIWKECTLLQVEMKKLLNTNNNPFRKEIADLRSKLRSKYLYLLEEHSAFSFKDKDVLVNLWKFVFYKQIEFCRKQLRKKAKQESNAERERARLNLITKLTESIIPDAKSVYNALLTKHLAKSLIQPSSVQTFTDLLLTQTQKDLDVESMRTSLVIAHKSLIYIGDLERYKETYLLNGGNYSAAKLSYRLASQLMPTRGNPHNQLAVLHQMQVHCDLSAIYRYVLSLFVIEPFKTAKENLSLLFKKTITLIDKKESNAIASSVEACAHWRELQVYVIYVLGTIYLQPASHHKISHIVLDKISNIVLDEDDKKDNRDDTQSMTIIKHLCIISIFLVTECFNEPFNGYKQAISWTLSLITIMMRALTRNCNLSFLPSITLCCSWLQNNFGFVVPDINESPWVKMEIDQKDLKPNNAFFTQFAKLLNLLHRKYQTKTADTHAVITPEQIEFYGVKQLKFVDFDDTKYCDNQNYIFIYHRRFHSKTVQPKNTKAKLTKTQTLNYLRYLKLVQFAKYSSSKIEGVLVFNDGKWIANKLLTIEEPQQNQSNSPILPPIPRKQSSLDSYYHSPLFHPHHHHHHQPSSASAAYNNNYSRSAPSSPRAQFRNNHYLFKQQPPLIEYPENDEVNFGPNGYPSNMIKSTPTTPKHNGNHSVYHPHSHSRQFYLSIPQRNTHSQSAQTAGDNVFSFNTAYAHAASNAPFHSHVPHAMQPVTQPTTPVFASHHANNYHAPPLMHLQPPSAHYPQQQQQQYQQYTNDLNLSSPLFCEDIVSEVFNELQLSQTNNNY
eukprot:206735_1